MYNIFTKAHHNSSYMKDAGVSDGFTMKEIILVQITIHIMRLY